MIRWLHMLSMLAVLATAGVLVLWRSPKSRGDAAWVAVLQQPGAVQSFLEHGPRTSTLEEPLSPLLAAARMFASRLNPPAPVPERLVVQEAPKPVAPAVRPPAPSPKFKLRGTSYASDRPERSMALIWEPGATDNGRWVRQGTQVGHLLIQQVRPGSVVYLNGEQVHEMAVEPETVTTSVTADSGAAAAPEPRMAANVPAAPLVESARRPRPSRGMTVGSARTAALD